MALIRIGSDRCVCMGGDGKIMISRGKQSNIEEEPCLVPILPKRIVEELTWESDTRHSQVSSG
jgi:hypothetical protein